LFHQGGKGAFGGDDVRMLFGKAQAQIVEIAAHLLYPYQGIGFLLLGADDDLRCRLYIQELGYGLQLQAKLIAFDTGIVIGQLGLIVVVAGPFEL